MGFEQFAARIESPALCDVAQHWHQARGARRMPGWSQIDPTEIARHLPIIWSWRFDVRTGSFTGRLSGEDINNAFGKSVRGARMEEFFAPDQYDHIYARHRQVVTEPCFAHGIGAVFIHADRYGEGERIILPLAEDGLIGDGIIGATYYRFVDNPPVGSRMLEETVSYFSL
ncbi:MAG: PAS domain-containing protein [Proteobacteria bacterium]|nr:PAS domain-containing protein [Pseudomonadota bacterium]